LRGDKGACAAWIGWDRFFALTDASRNILLDEDRYIDEWGRIFSRKVRAGTMSDFYIGGYLTTPENIIHPQYLNGKVEKLLKLLVTLFTQYPLLEASMSTPLEV